MENIGMCNYCNYLYDCDNNYDEERVRECIKNKVNILKKGD